MKLSQFPYNFYPQVQLKTKVLFISCPDCYLQKLYFKNSSMGQAYCVKLCGQNEQLQKGELANLLNSEADEPISKFAKKVRQHIEIHPKVKETYLLYRTPHSSEKRGVKLELYYLFNFGAYYEGEWKSGLPHGFGRIIYDDGSLYEGCFNNGVAECKQALFIREDGSFYRGNIRNNKANGYGQLSTPKLFYKGYWQNDLPCGKAREIYSSISYYEGQFVNGMKQGNGVYQWNANQYYIGKFHLNKLEGKGDLITKEYSFKGDFRDGRKSGDGKLTDHINKFTYQGKFQENKPKGKGEIVYQDGAVFSGEFDGFDKRKGALRLPSGETFQIDSFIEESSVDLPRSTVEIQKSEYEMRKLTS